VGKNVPDQEFTDQEAEARANVAPRPALSPPYKPQSDMKVATKKKKKSPRTRKAK
jgi:hypothetical protein